MKTVIVTQSDPLFIPTYLRNILIRSSDVSAIIILPSFTTLSGAIKRIYSFFGPMNAVKLAFRQAVTLLLRPISYLKGSLAFASTKKIAGHYGVPVYSIKNINSSDGVNLLRSLNPDLIFSLAAPQLFSKSVLEVPQWGCYNIHSSVLPKYRGQQAIFWALLNGENSVGFTIHRMASSVDTGPIFYQSHVPVYQSDTYESACFRVIETAAPKVVEFFNQMRENGGNVTLHEQKSCQEAKNYPFPSYKDRKKFEKLGRKIFGKRIVMIS